MTDDGPKYPPAPAGNQPAPYAVRGEALVLPDIEWAIRYCPLYASEPYGDYYLHRYPEGGMHWSQPERYYGVHDNDEADAALCGHFDVVAVVVIEEKP